MLNAKLLCGRICTHDIHKLSYNSYQADLNYHVTLKWRNILMNIH